MGSLILRLIRFTNHSNQLSNNFLKRFDLTTAQFDELIQIHVYQPLTQIEIAVVFPVCLHDLKKKAILCASKIGKRKR
jgi:hypothetical protein